MRIPVKDDAPPVASVKLSPVDYSQPPPIATSAFPAPPLPPSSLPPSPPPAIVMCGCGRHSFKVDRDPYEAHRVYVIGVTEMLEAGASVAVPSSRLGVPTPPVLLVDVHD